MRKDVEKINEMIQMQEVLDEAFMENALFIPSETDRTVAWLDELGEFTHEVKKSWCWWKHTQKDIDRQRALEELVDMFHFAFGMWAVRSCEDFNQGEYRSIVRLVNEIVYKPAKALEMVVSISGEYSLLRRTLIIMLAYGFNIDEVYEEYMKKNKENYDRIARGGIKWE